MDLLPWAYQGFGLAVAETMEGRWGEYRERAQVEVLVRGARGHMMPGVLMQIAVMLALGSGVVRAVGPAAAGLEAGVPEVQAHGNDEAGLKPRYVAVVGFKTLSSGGDDESWMGVGLGEELATRLSMAGNAIKTIERLQLSEILAPCAVLPGVPPAQTVPHMVIGDENPELDKACAAALRQAKTSGTLYSADALIVGTLLCDGQFLSATTRLVDVETGAVQWGVTARVPGSRGSVEAVRSLAATLTESWCGKLNVPVLSEMRDVGVEKASVYQALWQARQSLYDGRYEQCLETIAWAEAQTPGLEQLEGLMATRDDAWGQQLERVGPDELQVQGIIAQMLQSAQRTKDYYKQGHAMSCYYMGRAYEKAGSLAEAEAEYRECLEQRPSRLLWEFEAGCAIDDPLVVDGIAYAGSEDGHVRAFNARSGQVLWDFEADTAPILSARMRRMQPGPVVPATSVSANVYLCGPDPAMPDQAWPLVGLFRVDAVVDGVAYVGSSAQLSALESTHGQVLWEYTNGWTMDAPVVANGRAYIASNDFRGTGAGLLSALDAKSGKVIWQEHFGQRIWRPKLACGLLWVGSRDGHVRAFDVADGRLRRDVRVGVEGDRIVWVSDTEPASERVYVYVEAEQYLRAEAQTGDSLCAMDARDGRLLWRHEVASGTSGAIMGQMVYLRGTDSRVHGLDACTGAPVCTFDAGADMETTVLDGNVACALSGDGRIRAFHARTGTPLWDTQVGTWRPTVCLANGAAYTTSDDGCLWAFWATDGALLWKATGINASWAVPVVTPAAVYAQSRDGLMALDARTGEVIWNFSESSGCRPQFVAADVLYASSYDGHLRAFRTDLHRGPDYEELATTRLMVCLEARGRPVEAARFAARLFRQTEQRSQGFRDAYPVEVVLAGLPRAMKRGLRTAIGDQTGVGPPLEPLWSLGVGEEITQITVAGDTVFAGAADGQLRAIDSTTGALRWRCRTDGTIAVGTVAFAQDRAYAVGTSGDPHLWAIDTRTGRVIWEHEAKEGFSWPVVGEGVVCVVDRRRREPSSLQAFDAETGKLLWASEAEEVSPAAMAGGAAYFNTCSGAGANYVRAVDVRTGEQLWRRATGNFHGTSIVVNGGIYVVLDQAWPREGSCLLAIDARQGNILWSFDTMFRLTAIDVSGGMVLVGSDDGYLCALDARTGARLWACDVWSGYSGLSLLVEPDGRVVYAYSGCDHGVYAVDSQTGEHLWEFERRPGDVRLVVRGDLVLLVYPTDGHVQAVDRGDGRLVWDEYTGGNSGLVGVSGRILCAADERSLCAFELPDAIGREPWPVIWDTPAQLWSYMIWGKGGLAARQIRDGAGLAHVISSGSWVSADALANEIDRLAMLRDWSDTAVTARGNWENPKAMAEDPAAICPPELSAKASLLDQGIRPAAQFYLQIARRATDPRDMLEYAAEALRLSAGYGEAASVEARAHKLIGARRLDSSLYAEAIVQYTEAIGLDPTDAVAYNDRGFAYFALGDYAKAVDDLDRAIELDPRLATAYCNRANAECVLGAYDAAEADCDAALALDTTDPAIHSVLSVLCGLIGRYERAVTALERSLRAFEDTTSSRVAAIRAYRICLPQSPDPLELYKLSLAMLLEGTADAPGAVEWFSAYLDAEPNGAYAPEARRRLEALR